MDYLRQSAHGGITIENVRDYVVGIHTRVPLLDGSHAPYINFDNAASTPVLRPVLDKINELMNWYSSIHRGSGFKSQLSSELYDQAREQVARFVGLDLSGHAVIFVKNTTEAINKLAHRLDLSPGDKVLVTRMEHHSNDLPWRKRAGVIHIDVDSQGRLREQDLIRQLEQHRDRVKLFAVTGASNVTGWVNDIHRLAAICHRYGVKILVDAAQLIPHRKIDMRPQADPGHIDFLAFSAHKMYAPFGAGVLIGDQAVFQTGEPDMVGGGTVDIVSYDRVEWTAPPEKEEAGTPNTVGVLAMVKAMMVLEEIGMERVAEHEARLTRYALERLREIPEIRILGGDDPNQVEHRLGVITFNIGALHHALVAAILNHEAGIAVRNGCFCAHPYIKLMLGISEEEAAVIEEDIRRGDRSRIPGAVRVSFGIYNTEQEIDTLIHILQTIARREWKGEYVLDRRSGAYRLKNARIDYESYFIL